MAGKSTEFNFEKSLLELERLVEKMEQGEYSLEDAIKQFEKGIALVRSCQHALKEAEQKVQILIETDGEQQITDFVAPDASGNDE